MTHPKFEKSFCGIRNRLQKIRVPGRIIFIVMGILSTIWFLVRVVPKPQRAGYPCMKAAFPLMSAFVVWILSITGSIAAIKKARKNLKAQKYLVGISFALAALTLGAIAFVNYQKKAEAAENYVDNSNFEPNEPMGEGVGIHPGRVVWIHDKDATNADFTNSVNDPYYAEKNNDPVEIRNMFDDAILKLTQEKSLADAWDGIFESFNERKKGVKQGYQEGESIFIKINNGTASWAANGDLSHASWQVPIAETSIYSIRACLEHLVNIAGVPQSDIYIGDPRSHVWKEYYDVFSAEFPDINYVDKNNSTASSGRYILHENAEPFMIFSDKGEVMPDAVTDKSFDEVTQADYLINIAALKAHARAGITLTAKNHFGTHYRAAASHMHPSLVAPENDTPINVGDYPTVGYGKYRVLVDIMGHEVYGQNTLLFFVDGLFGGPEATDPPEKFQSSPFDNDWSNSIIISQDQVALESVCFDILRYEYNDPTDFKKYRPHMYGADDYLQQAADPANWPEGIIYDPEDDGTPIGSLGIHEHWNSFPTKQYSRNLGMPYGIELITEPENLSAYFPFVARKVDTPPTIDGDGSDAQWQDSPWYPINNTWITYGEVIPEGDYKGEFKVLWSEADNALHYLVKIHDDVFVDGYQYPNGSYPDFDIVEVFIDEDRSGGPHIFDNGSENAENAFSYHIAVDAPADGEVTNDKVVLDIAGTGWNNRITPDYADHFPALAMKKTGNEYTYEFTMAIYSDAYDPNDEEASRVTLETGKIMGMSVAYCDNDTPGTTRDNFFGSVWVTEEAFNNHWELADDYGKLALGDEAGNVPVDVEVNSAPVVESSIDDYTILVRGENETVVSDYNTIFSDPDEDELTYSLSSSNEQVHVFFYGNEIKVRAAEDFAGTATITLTASDGMDQSNVTFEVSFVVSVDLNTMDNTLSCYPNPVTTGIMTVKFSESGNGEVSLNIMNLNGQVIKQITEPKSGESFETRLDMSDIRNGLYLLEIKYNNKRAVVRFTK